MTGAEALAWLQSGDWRTRRPGLERICALLHALGDPQRGQKYIHVAGTNGKGSVCACLAAVLQAAGYKVGLFTSPHLERLQERIRINGAEIPCAALSALAGELRTAAEAMAEPPTEFELLTALALTYFRRRRCDIAVLEVGLGGQWDATNAIDVPEAAVLTAMSFDHTAILGSTMEEIAAAKAGIIKPGGSVVSLGGCPAADAVFRAACRRQSAELIETDLSRLGPVTAELSGCTFTLRPYGEVRLPLAGIYQPQNAALAVTALELLRRKGWDIPREAVLKGLAAVRWPGRFELLRRNPIFLLDGAHNPQGTAAAAESLRRCLPGRQVVFLLGVMADKDVSAMLKPLFPLAAAFVTVAPASPRAMSAADLAARLVPMGRPIHPCAGVAEAVRAAVQLAGEDGVVCALGSLYLSAPVRAAADAL